MSIRKINNSDYKNLLISNLPTRPNASPSNFGGGGLSANQMKKAYDATPLFIIGRFNELIDYINGTGDARLADDILNAIKGVIASKVETDIEGIATLSDLFASVESGELAKAIRVSDGKTLDETLKTIGEETITEVERILAEYEAEKLAPIVAEAESLRESVSSAQSRLSRVEKQVENINAGVRLPVVEDADVAYTKIVPDGALPYAEVAKVGGMSYKSVNLLDMSNCVRTENTTMVVGEGTLTVTGYIVQSTITRLVGGKTYTFKANSTRTSETEGGGISIECFDSNSAIVYSTYRQHTLNPNVTFTVPSGTVRTRFYFYGGMQASTTSATYTDVMLNEGSTALPYSPYFEGLRHAKVTEIKSESANVLDIDGEEWGATGWFTSVENGVKIDSFSKNSYEFTAKNNHINITSYSSGSFFPWLSKFIKLKPNTTYRLYQSEATPYVSIVGLNDIAVGTVGTKLTITGGIFNSGSYKHWMISLYGTGSANVMINYGDTALPFTPYAEYEPLPIPSAVQALEGYGLGVSATANNYIDWVEKKFYKNCGVLDLSRQSIAKNTNDNGQTIWGIDLDSIKDLGVCDKYTFTPTVSINAMQEGTIHNRGYVLYICDSSISSASEIKGTFIYALATPEVTDISHLLPDDNFIRVEGGGTITAVNEYGLAAPTEIIYQKEGKQ